MNKVLNESNNFRLHLQQKYPQFLNSYKINLDSLQVMLGKHNSALVVCNLHNNKIHLQYISKDKYKIDRNEIKLNLIDSINYITSNKIHDIKNYKKYSKIIFNSIVEPWFVTNTEKNVIFVLHKELFKIPLNSIIVEEKESSNYCDHTYLIDKINICYSTSIKTLYDNLEINDNFSSEPSISAFSFTNVTDIRNFSKHSKIEELPGALKEVQMIKNKFPNSSCYFGEQASVKNFIKEYQSGKNILHISMHGVNSNFNRDLNNIIFKSKNKLDTLYSYELQKLNSQDIDLTILSSCSGSNGKIELGEGVYSMSRQFLLNGSKNVISNKWSLDDKTAFSISKELYASNLLLYFDFSLNSSIRKVKSSSNTCHPYYWAGFELFKG